MPQIFQFDRNKKSFLLNNKAIPKDLLAATLGYLTRCAEFPQTVEKQQEEDKQRNDRPKKLSTADEEHLKVTLLRNGEKKSVKTW